MTDREYDTSIAGLNMNGFGPDVNPYGQEDCYVNQNANTSEIAHNGIGLPTLATHPATPSPSSDPYYELVNIFRRSMKNDETEPTRPHKITMHMSGVDLIRFVQLAMTP